ncbi:hypothetical protein LDENG_00085370 [Lucifuga dentata]|nr:hypothetical protein LDENG_00085370 [Lucifuga dentata]
MKTISVFCCLLCASWTGAESDIIVEGFERGEVTFRCSHSLAWKYNKYLCRDPCTDSDHKLVTVVSGGKAEKGRIILVDSGDGGFTVNFTQLQRSDSGRYWCGVDRIGIDTYNKVDLLVKDATSQTTTLPEASPAWTCQNFSTITHQMDISTHITKASNSTDESEENISSGL